MSTIRSRAAAVRGFSMVEIAIAVLILALAILPLVGVFISSSEEARANKNRTFAAALASSVIERYRHLTPSVLATVSDWASPSDVDQQKVAMQPGGDVPSFIEKDPFLSPWSDANQKKSAIVAEFASLVQGRFRRFCSFEKVDDRRGWLSVTVVWVERAAGISRTVSYSLTALVTDPVFPLGRAP